MNKKIPFLKDNSNWNHSLNVSLTERHIKDFDIFKQTLINKQKVYFPFNFPDRKCYDEVHAI